MKSRNLLNIFLLCCVFGLFLVFGAVANAAETSETGTETFSYNLYYETQYSKTANYKFLQVTVDGLNDLPYRIVGLQSEPQEYDVGTDNQYTLRSVSLYYLKGDGLSLFSKKVDRSIVKISWKDKSETVADTTSLSVFSYSSISTDIPLYDDTEEGRAAALEYLKTGKQTKEGYNIYLNDLKVSDASKDVVNVSWTGYTLDPALRNNANIVDYKVERRVYPYVELSEGETDKGWNPWLIYNDSVAGKLLNADFVFSPLYECPYKNGFSQLWLDLWPVCIDADGTEYVGKKYHYYFDAEGNLTHSEVPDGATKPIYDPDCYFTDFSSSCSDYDRYGKFLDFGKTAFQECDIYTFFVSASGFSHSYDVVSRDVKVYVTYPGGLSSGYEVDFDTYGFFNGSGFAFDITLGKLRKLCGFSAVQAKGDNDIFTLKFVPYYSSGDNRYYGNASVVEIDFKLKGTYQEVGDPGNYNNPRKELIPEVDISGGDAGGGSGGNTPTEADKNTILSFIKGFFELMAALFQESVKFLKQLPSFLKSMWSLIDLVGQFPAMVSKVFSFLPSVYSTMLVGGLALAILLRIFGR